MPSPSRCSLRRCAAASWAILLLALLTGAGGGLRAEPAANAELVQRRDVLFRQTLKRPQDVALALDYVRACLALDDTEAAIGTLERLTFYRPDDPELKAQLGFLYYKLQSHGMARQYFDAALPAADGATRAKIASIAPTIDAANTGDHVFGTLGGGLRYQSNAAFNPDGGTLRLAGGGLAGEDYLFTHPQDRGSDGNAFAIGQIGYDHDLGNQRGDVLEARVTGYLTRQFRLTDLDIGFYDASIGPRFTLASELLPGATVKPYAVGGQTFLAGRRYLASGGAGILADLPVRAGVVLEPSVEVRRVQFSGVSVFSSLNTGDAVTFSLAGTVALSPQVDVSGRIAFARDAADAAYQSTSNIAEELAIVARFAPPLPVFRGPWSVSPYVKLLQTRFDGVNPSIDPAIVRRDSEVQVGLVLDTPLTSTVDLVTNVQDARVASNIPNYRLHNFSVLTGPTVRF